MAVTKAAQKEIGKNKKRRLVNEGFKRTMTVSMNILMKKIKKGEKIEPKELSVVYKNIDKALKKRIIHKKNAARKKARMAKMFNQTIKSK